MRRTKSTVPIDALETMSMENLLAIWPTKSESGAQNASSALRSVKG